MKLFEALMSAKFDKRLLDFNLNNGIVTEAEYKKHLAGLTDLAGSAEKIDFDNSHENGADYSTEQ